MEKPINEIFEQYKWNFWVKVDSLVKLRRQKFTQEQMAFELKVSLKKIQMFENYKCLDAYLLYGYKEVLF